MKKFTKIQVESFIKETVANKCSISVEEVNLYFRCVDDLGSDFLGLLKIIMVIEKEFNVFLPTIECEKVQTVNDLYEMTIRNLEAQKCII